MPATNEIEKLLHDPRLAKLQILLGGNFFEAAGVVTILWAQTRAKSWSRTPTRVALSALFGELRTASGPVLTGLIDAGFVEALTDGTCRVVDNDALHAYRDKMRVIGKRGGDNKQKARQAAAPELKQMTPVGRQAPLIPAATQLATTPPRRKVARSKEPSPSAGAWAAYETAYWARYGVAPIRNQMVNGQMARLVALVGGGAAAELARFYVSHNAQAYVRQQHPVGLLLKDASGLHTQMRTGLSVTDEDARAQSQASALTNQLRRLELVGH